MKKTISEYEFINEFQTSSRKDNFSYDALTWLYQYYTETEEATGEEFELDIIAICCDWTEYDKEELICDYGYLSDLENKEDENSQEELIDDIISKLEDKTTIANLCGSYLVLAF